MIQKYVSVFAISNLSFAWFGFLLPDW